ncbi:Clavaminate synthase-like protein [Exidia glandulosa HHB12029]|uniref:Clavaminate synthase-like protein n=1 Tax=Exidia glandulosa HHB12029 TaxID=1314781 RepID=A0A166A9I3_EXIGL|nr:Clavaminate synthase-like protein [Exidia glandulosa HHB12029]
MKPLARAAAVVSDKLYPPSVIVAPKSVAAAIVDLIGSYLLTSSPDDKFASVGRARLLATVDAFVREASRIALVLPAFPFKSPSNKKVLGTLPDMAEEIVLRRLEDLCRAIDDVYEPGCLLHIVSDGIVYGELLGVPDSTVAAYNEELRRLTDVLKLTHIDFVRVADLLIHGPQLGPPLSPEDYIASAPTTRAQFLAVALEHYDLKFLLANDVGALRTYRGYLRFLELDLDGNARLQGPDGRKRSNSERGKILSGIAKEMMINGARFSWLVQQKFPDACIQAPGGADGGRTLFTNTHMLLQQGVNPTLLEKMKLLDWSVFTPQNKNFGGEPLKIPLVHRHEATGHDVLRWHEDWPQRITTFKPTSVRINGVDAAESDRVSELLTKLLYDRRFVYEHMWTTGDYLIADNIELMHTRTAFSPCTRELWRIHAN